MGLDLIQEAINERNKDAKTFAKPKNHKWDERRLGSPQPPPATGPKDTGNAGSRRRSATPEPKGRPSPFGARTREKSAERKEDPEDVRKYKRQWPRRQQLEGSECVRPHQP